MSPLTPPKPPTVCNVGCLSLGAKLNVEVTSELSQRGQFWCQILFPEEEDGAYTRLQNELQSIPTRGEGDLYTPVFYSEGETCAACFSDDEEWYRARIEKITPGMVQRLICLFLKWPYFTSSLSLPHPMKPHALFTVRYVDFGNSEERQQHHLMVLGSKFKLLPPQAICCNIATDSHQNFTSTVSPTTLVSITKLK